MDLYNKKILILSPQQWGSMHISKHHYAIELSRLGNKVYYLNPPNQNGAKKDVAIRNAIDHPGLFLIDQKLFFPYNLKFRWTAAFHWLMGFQIRKVLKAINEPIEVVWSFDLAHLYPLKYFRGASLKIFQPVDLPGNDASLIAAKGAHVIFSLAREILERYKHLNIPSYFINHGVAEYFLKQTELARLDKVPTVGISGNLLRGDIDRATLLAIVDANAGIEFNFWGANSFTQTNIGGSNDAGTHEFIQALRSRPNVKLHGAVHPEILAVELQSVDVFLICYDVQKDQSKGTNYHKVMEYLGVGKVIVSNNITTYDGPDSMIEMVAERDHNRALPALFAKVVKDLDHYNSIEKVAKRRAFAADNSYASQVLKINRIVGELNLHPH